MLNTNHYANGYTMATPRDIKNGAQLYLDNGGTLSYIGKAKTAVKRNDSIVEYATTSGTIFNNNTIVYVKS